VTRSSETAAAPPADEHVDLTLVEAIVKSHGQEPRFVVPILQAIQQEFRFLPPQALRHVCNVSDITPAQIAGVSTFYRQFRHRPMGRHLIRVCHGTACHVAGAPEITDAIREHWRVPADDDTDPSRVFTVEKVACIGCCSLAPCLMIDQVTYGRLTPRTACRTTERFLQEQAE